MSKKKQQKKSSSNANSCLLDGCVYADLSGCADFDGDGCIDLEIGGCVDFGDGCSLIFVSVRWLVILGLMLYGDWDYSRHRAKE